MDWPRLLSVERRRQTTRPQDHRREFERDFDRAVFSTPVKRLQGKAQVFPLDPNDTIRTRLTHSLEVSSVARGLAGRIAERLHQAGQIKPEMIRSIEAIAATCGLVHDLGNPPFGHAGEKAIRSWFQQERGKELVAPLRDKQEQFGQDFLKFEGNAQSLRLVATLHVLADYKGLNFTFGTLSALMKYVASSDRAKGKEADDPAFGKPGYFASESGIVNDIRAATGIGEARHPICFLVEAADDIVYLPADVEDGIRKGVMSWSTLEQLLRSENSRSVGEALEGKVRILQDGSVVSRGNLEDDIHAAAFRTSAIGIMVEKAAKTFKHNYESIMKGTYHGTLLGNSDARDLERVLRRIGKEYVYRTPSTLKLELTGRHVICGLMDVLWEGARVMPLQGAPDTSSFAGKAAALFSDNYRRVFQHFATTDQRLPDRYHRLQLLTDYVCGMTDSFATRLHRELFNGS